jgi:CMP-N-acetylneuraminic acid synthetase
MNVLGLIPARGGSKGIPRKNIVDVAGRSLLSYTCEAASTSQRISRVVLSTDDEEIAAVGRDWGAEVPFMRPAHLAEDTTLAVPVAQHAIDWLQQHESWLTDILVYLQPTSPLRTAQHIDEALAKLDETGADTVVSLTPIPHAHTPYKVSQIVDGRVEPFWKAPLNFNPLQRQDVPVFYARNGPAVLACRATVLAETGTFYGDHIVPYIMSPEDSIDIDTPFDLKLADFVLRGRG